MPREPELGPLFIHPFRPFDYGPDGGPSNGQYYMPINFGGKLIFEDVAGKSTAQRNVPMVTKADQFLFEYIMESALFYNLCCHDSKRHIKQLLGILLLRMRGISRTLGAQLARRTVRQFIALGLHISDDFEDRLCSLWSVANLVSPEDLLFSGDTLPSPSPRPTVEKPNFLLQSPVLDFLSDLLDTIARKAGNEAVRISLENLNSFCGLISSTEVLYFGALLSNKARLVSLLLQFSIDLDVNEPFQAFGGYYAVKRAAYGLEGDIHNMPPYSKLNISRPVDRSSQSLYLYSLDFVSISGQLETLKVLLEHPGTRTSLASPMALATYVGNLLSVELLLNAGMNVNLPLGTFHGVITPLHFAAVSDQVAVAETLLRSGALVNANIFTGGTPLHVAFSAAMAKVLVNGGADPNAKTAYEKKTPLHSSTMQSAVATVLLEAGADPNAKDHMGNSPLHFTRNIAKVEMLLDAGADPSAKNDEGKTARPYTYSDI
jgi:ankyrin repeat protein